MKKKINKCVDCGKETERFQKYIYGILPIEHINPKFKSFMCENCEAERAAETLKGLMPYIQMYMKHLDDGIKNIEKKKEELKTQIVVPSAPAPIIKNPKIESEN